ncbi:SDR family NAD(P)-dependent oxidoreductase [Blastococcus sp. URHD0036]|uniref:SDR family NAD(P)-dependent oxidoreductase n=1 Tax=Blastococcus sp. URHD0036 TaxID=1380356 RepID=UPI0004984640|nr:SDR family oxidoreductase [Blastococcus sp. URHD0036]
MSDRFSVEGRVAVVTGGGTGIGRASALLLAEHGADVVLAGRRPEPLEQTAAEIEQLGRRALAAPTDVTDAARCQDLVDRTLQEFGRLDILVNSAGGAPLRPILDVTEQEWQDILALNLGSAWFLSRCAAHHMIGRQKGAIVNISSGASMLAMPPAAVYGAAKAALNSLTGSMAAAWTGQGVRVNGIAVGAVRAATLTDEAQRMGLDAEDFGRNNGLGRLGDPDEIAHGVLFFASDASSFCSGQTLRMHGGPGASGV